MATLTIPNNIQNGDPIDAVPVDANFDAIAAHVNTELVNRDGSVAMTGALLLPSNPTSALQAATKQYVDAHEADTTSVHGIADTSTLYRAGGTDVAVADGGTGASTAATARTNLGLGTIATQASSSVSITGGTITGITDLAVADGGTGASTAANARTNLGLGTLATYTEGAWQAVSLQNGWTNFAGRRNARYRLIGDIVYVEGSIVAGTKAAGTVVWVFAGGYRPLSPLTVPISNGSDVSDTYGSPRFYLDSNGEVEIFGLDDVSGADVSFSFSFATS